MNNNTINSETSFDDLLAVWKNLDTSEITDTRGMQDTVYALLILQDREESLTELTTYLWGLEKRLTAKIVAWLEAHPEDTVEGGFVEGKGNEYHATVIVRDRAAEILRTLGGLVREDGGKLTQEFLKSLPEKWRTSALKLDTAAINRLKVTDTRLAAKGLHRPVKYVISDATETVPTREEVK